MFDQETQKRMAAEAAADYIENGDIVGLGTGSTVKYVLEALGKKVQQGLNILGVATSVQTAQLAKSLNIPLITLDEVLQGHKVIDIAIDGADQIDESYHMIKGGGGAMHREKIILMCSDLRIIIVDDSKMVKKLGGAKLPVEVTKFSYLPVMELLKGSGLPSKPRLDSNGNFFITDNGHYILDCKLPEKPNLDEISALVSMIPGVVDHGLFMDLASIIVVGGAEGLKIHEIEEHELSQE